MTPVAPRPRDGFAFFRACVPAHGGRERLARRSGTAATRSIPGNGSLCIVEDDENRALCIFDHLEYDDVARCGSSMNVIGRRENPSLHHAMRRGRPWQPYAALFFRNWLDG